jgi:uncharacterized repeat protein (TIGR03803 family)
MPSNRTLDLVISLPLRNQDALTNLLHDIYDPSSPSYRKFLTSAGFAQRFGPSAADYDKAASFFKAHGFTVTGRHENRTLLDVRGNAATIENALHLRLHEYRHPNENRTFHAPDSQPAIDLDVPVLAVNGLDDYALPRPLGSAVPVDLADFTAVPYASGSGPLGTLLGGDFRAAYATGVSLDGAGEAVGIFSLDGYYPADILAYENLAGLPHVAVTNVLVNGFNGAPGGNNVEAALDISMSVSMAPGLSKVIMYEGKVPLDVLNTMATDNQARQLSCSWGFQPPVDPARDQIFLQFAAQGQSFYQASGDLGAWGKGIFPPSDNPYITIVGGTTLQVNLPDGTWQSEVAWTGSGGGVSTNYSMPPWQQGVNMAANLGSTTMRNIPDVAATADGFFWLIANNGEFFIVGGTSGSTPLWAGFTALANQQAAFSNSPPIGFANPALYAIGKSAAYGSAFHDVVSGNNTNGTSTNKFFAVPGYDLCTGWGTPNGGNLIASLINPPAALRVVANPLFAQGPPGGPFVPSSQNLTLTNFGRAALTWSVVQTAPWLKLTPSSGTLVPGGSAATILATLTSSATNLSSGTYTATLTFNNSADYSTQTRTFTLCVVNPPAIAAQPANQSVFEGQAAGFSVTAGTNAFVGYQWQFNNGAAWTNLVDGPNISGSTSANLTIAFASLTNVGAYAAMVTNAAGNAASSNAYLSIVPWPPVFIVQPTNQMAMPGQLVTLHAVLSGSRPLAYRWQKGGLALSDGGEVSGASTADLQLANVASADAGSYALIASNAYGTATSSVAAVTVPPLLGANVALSTIHSFSGGSDGARPNGLTLLPGGDFLGTCQRGGSNNAGAVFHLDQSNSVAAIHNFNGTDGESPFCELWPGPDGQFYGSTVQGGAFTDGTIFRMTATGFLTNVVQFNGGNGGFQYSPLTTAADGNLYGTTYKGGAVFGTVYRLSTNGAQTILYNFSGGADGGLPYGGLALASDGSLYGTTYKGGAGYGTVFRITTNGLFTSLFSFNHTNGAYPYAGLVLCDDGNLYGAASSGGAFGNGTLFRMAPSGQQTVLYSFTGGADGSFPMATLVQAADGNLYGSTFFGGAANAGAVFRIAPSTGLFSTVAQFDGYNGSNPSAPMVNGLDGLLYGATQNGGALGQGTIFQISYEGLAPQFTAQPVDRNAFTGDDVLFAPALVGTLPMTFQWRKNGTNLADNTRISGSNGRSLLIHNVTAEDVSSYSLAVTNAFGFAISTDAFMQVTSSAPIILSQPTGLTLSPGATAIFKIAAIGNNPLVYQWNKDGVPLTDTANIIGAASSNLTVATVTEPNSGNYYVVLSNSLGAVTSAVANLSVVPVSAAGTRLTTAYAFDGGTNGGVPNGLSVSTNGTIFGSTQNGGANAAGTLFMLTSTSVVTLAPFSAAEGSSPHGPPFIDAAGNLFGSTTSGGAGSAGALYEFLAGPGLQNIFSFSGVPDAAHPMGGLILGSDGNLYGTAQDGGAAGYGAVYRFDTNHLFSRVYSFTNGADGANPNTALTLGADGMLYGLTDAGANGQGNIFSLSPAGALSTIYTLANTTDGSYPVGPIFQGYDGTLFFSLRFAKLGGYTFPGGVFYVTTNGSFGAIYIFNPPFGDGQYPAAGVIESSDGNLYGTTEYGGTSGNGTIFVATRAGHYLTLVNLDGFNSGANPRTPVIEAPDGTLYATTSTGGPGGQGTILKLAFTSAPQITTQPAGVTLLAGSAVNFTVAALAARPMYYQWVKNGTNLFDAANLVGSQNRILSLTNISPADAGSYSVVITNYIGSVTSSVATLKVVFAPAVRKLTKSGNSSVVTFTSIPGQRYRLQYNTNLLSSAWFNTGGLNTTATTNTLSLTDSTATSKLRFYRVIMLP